MEYGKIDGYGNLITLGSPVKQGDTWVVTTAEIAAARGFYPIDDVRPECPIGFTLEPQPWHYDDADHPTKVVRNYIMVENVNASAKALEEQIVNSYSSSINTDNKRTDMIKKIAAFIAKTVSLLAVSTGFADENEISYMSKGDIPDDVQVVIGVDLRRRAQKNEVYGYETNLTWALESSWNVPIKGGHVLDGFGNVVTDPVMFYMDSSGEWQRFYSNTVGSVVLGSSTNSVRFYISDYDEELPSNRIISASYTFRGTKKESRRIVFNPYAGDEVVGYEDLNDMIIRTRDEIDRQARREFPSTRQVVEIANDIVDEAMPKSLKWNRPDAWVVDAMAVETDGRTIGVGITTNAFGMVYSNLTISAVKGLAAKISKRLVDEYSENTTAILSYQCHTAGGSFSNDYLVAENPGLYRFSVRDEYGETKSSSITLTNRVVGFTTPKYYFADTGGVRKVVNDAAVQVMGSAVDTGVYQTSDTDPYHVYSTFRPRLCNAGWGVATPIAISPHVLITATHYDAQIQPGTTVFHGSEGDVTVTRVEAVNCYDWALTNGWTESELGPRGVSLFNVQSCNDITFYRCDRSTAVPSDCIPSFISEAKIEELFGTNSLWGVSGWHVPQARGGEAVNGLAYAVPVNFRSSWTWAGPGGFARSYESCRYDFASLWFYAGLEVGRVGDSGKPVFFMLNGEPVLVSHCTTTASGPNYSKWLPIIKAFVENYGDQIKEVE